MKSAARLLALLNLARPTPLQWQEATELAPVNLDWDWLTRTVEQNSAWVLTARRLEMLRMEGVVLPESLEPRLRDWAKRAADPLAVSRGKWLSRFLSRCSKQGIEVILLKGAALGPALYGDLSYKRMNDVDVLIRREHARAALQILEELHFDRIADLLNEGDYSEKSHHAPPFVSQDQTCIIGLHWNLASPRSRWRPVESEIWEHAEPLPYGELTITAKRMSWEHNLVHLCMHLPFYKTGIRELADVFNVVLNAEPAIDWLKVADIGRRWRAEDALYRVLSLARAVMPFPIPEAQMREWSRRSSSLTRQDTFRRSQLGPALVASRSTMIGRIEKSFAVFRLSENYSERVGAWANTWRSTFVPPRSELPRLLGHGTEPGPRWREPLDRVQAPYRIWSALARDHGHMAVALITALNVLLVLRASLARPVRGPGRSLSTHPAAPLFERLE